MMGLTESDSGSVVRARPLPLDNPPPPPPSGPGSELAGDSVPFPGGAGRSDGRGGGGGTTEPGRRKGPTRFLTYNIRQLQR